MSKKRMSLLDATESAILCMDRDNKDWKHFWVSCSGHNVNICEQDNGHPAKYMMTIPKPVFRKMLKFLTKPRVLRKYKV